MASYWKGTIHVENGQARFEFERAGNRLTGEMPLAEGLAYVGELIGGMTSASQTLTAPAGDRPMPPASTPRKASSRKSSTKR